MSKNSDPQSSLVELMLEFVRAAVLDRVPIISQDVDIDWDKLQDISATQGLLAWVWDGICKLPIESQPPRRQRINWGLSAQEIWDNYAHFKDVLCRMIKKCDENKIRLLLFKGIAQSELYVKPESRPAGDIDIYLFDDYERGNELFAHENVSRTNKRTGFDYDGVHIENHRNFLNASTKLHIKAIHFLNSTLCDVRRSEDGYYVMSPISSIVYQVMHYLSHMDDYDSMVSIRNIVDFGISLLYYEKYIEPKRLRIVLDRLQLLDLFCLLTLMSERVLELEFPIYHYKAISIKDQQSMFQLILSRQNDIAPLTNRRPFEIISFFIKRCNQYQRLIKYLPQSRIKFVVSNYHSMINILLERHR